MVYVQWCNEIPKVLNHRAERYYRVVWHGLDELRFRGLVWVGSSSVGRGKMGSSVSDRACETVHVWSVRAGRARTVYDRNEVAGKETGWMGNNKVGWVRFKIKIKVSYLITVVHDGHK